MTAPYPSLTAEKRRSERDWRERRECVYVRGKEREKLNSERGLLEPKFLPSENLPAQRNLAVTALSKIQKGIFASPKNTEANLPFVVHAQPQRIQVFCLLHIASGVSISYLSKQKP